MPIKYLNYAVCKEEDMISGTISNLDDCEVLNNDAKCKRCKPFLVNNGGYCQASCEAGDIINRLDISDNNSLNSCFTNNNVYTNCKMVAPNYAKVDICILCEDGSIPTVDPLSLDSTNITNKVSTTLAYYLHSHTQKLNCVSNDVLYTVASVASTGQIPSLIVNCELYIKENQNFNCIKCRDFYTGVINYD